MSWSSFGDAAQVHSLRTTGTQLRRDLTDLSQALASGQQSDLGRATGGRFAPLATVTRGLALNESFLNAINTAALKAQGTQAALDRVQSELQGNAAHLLGLLGSGQTQDLVLANASAPGRFEQAVATLNTRIAGDALFAGDTPDRAPLIDGPEILDLLRPIAQGAADVDAAITAISAWFEDPGGGYETQAWQGGAGPAAPVLLAEGSSIDVTVSALDPALRQALSGMAMAALAAEGAVPSVPEAQTRMIEAAVSKMQTGETGLITLQAQIGASEARLDVARTQTEAARATLELEQARIIEADPYETAVEIEAVQARLESLYLLTARLSRLSLTEFLR